MGEPWNAGEIAGSILTLGAATPFIAAKKAADAKKKAAEKQRAAKKKAKSKAAKKPIKPRGTRRPGREKLVDKIEGVESSFERLSSQLEQAAEIDRQSLELAQQRALGRREMFRQRIDNVADDVTQLEVRITALEASDATQIAQLEALNSVKRLAEDAHRAVQALDGDIEQFGLLPEANKAGFHVSWSKLTIFWTPKDREKLGISVSILKDLLLPLVMLSSLRMVAETDPDAIIDPTESSTLTELLGTTGVLYRTGRRFFGSDVRIKWITTSGQSFKTTRGRVIGVIVRSVLVPTATAAFTGTAATIGGDAYTPAGTIAVTPDLNITRPWGTSTEGRMFEFVPGPINMATGNPLSDDQDDDLPLTYEFIDGQPYAVVYQEQITLVPGLDMATFAHWTATLVATALHPAAGVAAGIGGHALRSYFDPQFLTRAFGRTATGERALKRLVDTLTTTPF